MCTYKVDNFVGATELIIKLKPTDYQCTFSGGKPGPRPLPRENKKRSHTQLDSRKQVIAFQDRVITINIKEAQHPLNRGVHVKIQMGMARPIFWV